MKRYIGMCCALGLLAACTPADVQYCRDFGVEGTSEYGKCIAYYHTQQAEFDTDRSVCELEADAIYPQSLYDHGSYAHTIGGFGYGGRYYGGGVVRVDPDWNHNYEVDRLRMRIIEPCMQAKGWVSGRSWQAGRQAVRPQKRKPAPAEKLPWLK